MNIQETIKTLLLKDCPKAMPVKTILFQEMIWKDMVECRVFCADGSIYSCMYENDDKITPFVKVPDAAKPEGK